MNRTLLIVAFCCATSIAGAQGFAELQDSRHQVIGYVGPNATILNAHKEFIGQFKREGVGMSAVLDRNHQIIGHMTQDKDGITYQNAKNELIASMDRKGTFEDANHQVIGYINFADGKVEDKNHTVLGYEMQTEPMWAGPFYLVYKFQ